MSVFRVGFYVIWVIFRVGFYGKLTLFRVGFYGNNHPKNTYATAMLANIPANSAINPADIA